MTTRRELLELLAATTGATILAPIAVGCGPSASSTSTSAQASGGGTGGESAERADPMAVPDTRPDGWDPIAFNRARGNAGAIPESYRDEINGADGELMHLGKHLPYIPALPAGAVPAGMLAIMWGDPSLGRTRHPNAAPTAEVPTGHWYDWIRVRKATMDGAVETTSTFGGWPTVIDTDNGAYAAQEGTDVTVDLGKNTVYLVQLPSGLVSGDVIRVHANCLTHGEYVDFLTVP